MQLKHRPRPFVLIILDGWGHRVNTSFNAIATANKPHWDQLWTTYPHTLLSGSGRCVGLPEGQMGNSEVGHLNMGAGRVVHQELTRIDMEIENREFFNNPVLIQAFNQAKNLQKAIHIMGLLSPGGVHSHERHLHAMIKCAAEQKVSQVYLHLFLDGRDTPPKSAMTSLTTLNTTCKRLHCGQITSLIGRYYAMDRDKRWDRIQKAYELIATGKALYHAATAQEGLELAYARGETDEFVQATRIHSATAAPVQINDGDVLLFMNFRADRAREITQAFTDPHFTGFVRTRWSQLSQFICLSQYDAAFQLPVAYKPILLNYILGDYISQMGLQQLRIAETEKYAHVTFFFNGGIEPPYPGEDRILVPSPKIATYDLQPEMSAYELTTRLIQAIQSNQYDLIICNFANPDMVGHTGNMAATVQAIEVVDQCLGKIIHALQQVEGEAIITADHGNAEQLFDEKTNQPHTAHTSDPVPFIYIGRKAMITKENGILADIAPTILYLLGLPKPTEMTGSPIVTLS